MKTAMEQLIEELRTDEAFHSLADHIEKKYLDIEDEMMSTVLSGHGLYSFRDLTPQAQKTFSLIEESLTRNK